MTNDDVKARRARAARLREQIEPLKNPPLPAGDGRDKAVDPKAPSPSPRDFIHKRMEELDDKRRK